MANSVTCCCCNKVTETHLSVVCYICHERFYYGCANLTTSETRIINAKNSVNWSCPKCEKILPDLTSISATLSELRRELEELKATKLQTLPPTNDKFFEEVVQELSERNKRKNNIIVFNLSEQSSTLNNDDRNNAEKSDISAILKTVGSSINIDHINVQRLGKYGTDARRPRPLRIILPSEREIGFLLKNSNKLKTNQKYKNISISTDKTPRQINAYRELKKELEERRSHGESNLMIKYHNGIPKIVKNLN